jgi:hypothetical protein
VKREQFHSRYCYILAATQLAASGELKLKTTAESQNSGSEKIGGASRLLKKPRTDEMEM